MNIVTASFNDRGEISHDQNVSKETEHQSSGIIRGLNQGAKLSKMLKHTAIFSILVVMAVCFSILLVHPYA